MIPAASATAIYGVGERVVVEEPGLRPWAGTIHSVKLSSLSGWFLEVRRDDDGVTYLVHQDNVRPI